MKTLIIIVIVLIFWSCNSIHRDSYKVDKIVISNVHCRPIFENVADTGFGNCPKTAILIDKNLNYFSTEGSAYSSKLNCYSGTITQDIWNNIYKNYVTVLLDDTNVFDFNSYNQKAANHEIVDLYDGPEYFIVFSLNNKTVKTFRYRVEDTLKFKSFFDRVYLIKSEIKLSKMSDTILIDLSKYTLMPPPLIRHQQQFKFIKK